MKWITFSLIAAMLIIISGAFYLSYKADKNRYFYVVYEVIEGDGTIQHGTAFCKSSHYLIFSDVSKDIVGTDTKKKVVIMYAMEFQNKTDYENAEK